jgi:hypothetical protein
MHTFVHAIYICIFPLNMFPPSLYNPVPFLTRPTLLVACFMLVYCLAYSSTLKMEAICSSETSVYFHRTTRRYMPEDRTLPLKSSQILFLLLN